MLRIGIIGASGYSGSELMRILSNHPGDIKITCATSRTYAGQPVGRVLPNLRGLVDIKFEDPEVDQIAPRVDMVFLGLPHKTAMTFVPKFLDHNKKVIDFSADYRLKKADVYEKWYQEHTSPHLLEKAVYGLPEIHRNEIRNADLIANPGCFPTGAILAILPALKYDIADAQGIVIDSKTGMSGAGIAPSEATHLPSRYDNFTAYKVGSHRHTPEIEQELSLASCKDVSVAFVPHYVPMSRGILTTVYLRLSKSVSTKELFDIYSQHYKDEPFVRILDEGEIPQTQAVRGSNFCDIGLKVLEKIKTAIVISAIDNLTKGASSQAIQNMNIVSGFPETAGLMYAGLMP